MGESQLHTNTAMQRMDLKRDLTASPLSLSLIHVSNLAATDGPGERPGRPASYKWLNQ